MKTIRPLSRSERKKVMVVEIKRKPLVFEGGGQARNEKLVIEKLTGAILAIALIDPNLLIM
jgi:predicted metallopeptidase